MSPRFPNSLSTERLLIRRLQNGDAEVLCGYRSLPEVARYQSWETFTLEDAVHLVEDQQNMDIGIPGTWFQVAITERETGLVIGDCGLHCLGDEPEQLEFGITLAPHRHGQGLATEALNCLLDFVFSALPVHRVSALADARNDASAALFRRLGFRQEAHHLEHRLYKGIWASEFVFALLRREWELKQM